MDIDRVSLFMDGIALPLTSTAAIGSARACMYHVHDTRMRQEAIIMIRSAVNIIAFALMRACESISLFLVRVSMQTCTA